MADGNNEEDRFKEARRSLIDRQKGNGDDDGGQREDDAHAESDLPPPPDSESDLPPTPDAESDLPPPGDGDGADDFEDEKTMLMDVDDIHDEDFEETPDDGDASGPPTQEVSADVSAPRDDGHTTPTPGDDQPPTRGEPDDLPPRSDTPPGGPQGDDAAHQEASLELDDDDGFEAGGHAAGPGGTPPSTSPTQGTQSGDGQKMVVPGDSGEENFDEKTEFVNIDDFADDGPEGSADASDDMDATGEVTMDQVQEAGAVGGADISQSDEAKSERRDSQRFSPGSSGEDPGDFEGSTQFVNINDLSGGEESPADQILDDSILQSGYNFSEQGVECTEGANVVWAQNAIGKPVVLRQVWQGDAAEMPSGLRSRVATLDELQIDGLLAMEGLFTSESGCWVEMARPTGQRLGVLLKQQGEFSVEQTQRLLRGVAAILEDLQDRDFVYANLCPDAVWLQDDWEETDDPRDGIVLEPFDILSLGGRERLGHFAPPELHEAEDRDELTAETDVFGLAAIGVAASTGLPLNADRLEQLDDDGFVEALQTGMSQAPADRQDAPATLADAAGGGWIRPVKEFAVDLADEPVRLGIALMAVASVVAFGAMYVPTLLGSNRPPQPGPSAKSGAAAAAVKGKTPGKSAATKTKGASAAGGGPDAGIIAGGASGSDDSDDILPESELPGAVESLPNLTITRSYRTHPPKDDGPDLTAEERKKKLEKLRGDIQSTLDEADRLKEAVKEKQIKKALEQSAKAISLQQGDPAQKDIDLREKLFEREYADSYYDGVVSRAEKYLLDESIGEARFPFQSLTAISPDARGGGFFEQPNISSVEVVPRVDAESADAGTEESQ